MWNTGLRGLALAAVAVSLSGCDLFTGPKHRLRVKPELIRLAHSAPTLALTSAVPDWTTANASDAITSSAFEIISFRMPVFSVELRSSNDPKAGIQMYTCKAATNDGCLVELMGPALQDVLGTDPMPVNPGSFDELVVGLCKESPTHTAYVRGTIVLGGTTHYTKANGSLSPNAPAESAPVTWTGCGLKYPLLQTINIAEPPPSEDGEKVDPDDMVIPVRMYYDLQDIAWGATSSAWGNHLGAGCSVTQAQADAGTPFFCVAYPNLAGTLGKEYPTLERYRVGTSVTVGLFFSATEDKPLSGFSRRYFPEDAVFDPLFGASGSPFKVITENADGSYRLEGHPSEGQPDPLFPAFRRENHSGTLTEFGGTVKPYTAVKLP